MMFECPRCSVQAGAGNSKRTSHEKYDTGLRCRVCGYISEVLG